MHANFKNSKTDSKRQQRTKDIHHQRHSFLNFIAVCLKKFTEVLAGPELNRISETPTSNTCSPVSLLSAANSKIMVPAQAVQVSLLRCDKLSLSIPYFKLI